MSDINKLRSHLGNLWAQTSMSDIGSKQALDTAITRLEELEKEVIDRQENENSLTRWVNKLNDEIKHLEKELQLYKEFIDLCSIEIVDGGYEVVFWKDTNYDYAKEIIKMLKVMRDDR